MSGFIPQIGTKGVYTLRSPLDTLLLPRVQYTCIGIRRLADLVSAGENPLDDIYLKINLTEADYNADADDDEVCVISLQAGSDHLVYVPSSFLLGFPDMGGVPYTVLLMAINLGAIPDDMELGYVEDKISEVVLESLGVEAEVQLVAASLPEMFSTQDHEALEAARELKRGAVITDHSKLVKLQDDYDRSLVRIQELEAYIMANMPPTQTP